MTAKTPQNTTIAATSTNIDVTFSEIVLGVDATDLVLTGAGEAGASKGTPTHIGGNTWRFPVSRLTTGAVNVLLAPDAGDIVDQAANNLANFTWSFSVDVTPPKVVGVTVSGSSTTHAPYSVPVGSGLNQLRTVPVGGANQVTLVFDEQVSIQQSDLQLKGRDCYDNETTYSFTAFSTASGPGTGQYQATWTVSGGFGAREVSVKLLSSASNVRDLVGNLLDGEWDNPTGFNSSASDTFPTGNGVAGGNFQFFFTSLPGDANRDNIVDGADYSLWADNYGQSGRTFTQGDFNGDGYVDGADYNLWSDNYLTDFTGSFTPFGQMMGGGESTDWRALARQWVIHLYRSGARSWQKDAQAILTALDSAIASLNEKEQEAQFFEFDWLYELEKAAS